MGCCAASDHCLYAFQHRTVQRKGQAGGTRCAGETKTRSKEEKDGGHARETLNLTCPLLFLAHLLSRLYIYKRDKRLKKKKAES